MDTTAPPTNRATMLWTFVLTSLALFMVSLDNLVVTTALPVIKSDLGASIEDLEWTVNAYTLTFAVLLLTGAALGDRFGRRRVFSIGLAVFSLASAAAALAPSVDALVAARAVQGAAGALVMPLTLTLLSAAVPPERRGVALGAWGGVGGLAIALGPLVGGAIVDGISWQWIFWVNVPIGLVLAPLAMRRLRESHGPDRSLDLPGVALVSAALFGIVWGLVRGNAEGWGSTQIVTSLAIGGVLLVAFVAWEAVAAAPMLPLRFFRSRSFAAANVASLFMFFGMFGSIFLLAQFFQVVQGYSPLESGLRILPWTLMPMFVAPIAGAYSDRIGGGPLIAVGLALQAIGLGWVAAVSSIDMPYGDVVWGFVLSGLGMALFFAPVANVVLGSVDPRDEGKASGANNAIREVGGVLGVAVLASVFSHQGGYDDPQRYVDGMVAATWVGAAVVGLGAIAAVAIPRRMRAVGGADALAAGTTASPALGVTDHEVVTDLVGSVG
ncbi:MAG: family efflux transporter permease subunit [Thermoleophilia bacterium]|nr:family efflux transporter permease subunit [Thermoleophilia bacterium]